MSVSNKESEEDHQVLDDFHKYKSFLSQIGTTINALVNQEKKTYTSSRPVQPLRDKEAWGTNALEMRAQLGRDNSLYLRFGLSFLWSGEDKTALFPSTLPSIRRQMETTVYTAAIEAVISNTEGKINQLSQWNRQIDSLLTKYTTPEMNIDEFWKTALNGAVTNLLGDTNSPELEAYRQLPQRLLGIKASFRNVMEQIDALNRDIFNFFEDEPDDLKETMNQRIKPNADFNPACQQFPSVEYQTVSTEMLENRETRKDVRWVLGLNERSENDDGSDAVSVINSDDDNFQDARDEQALDVQREADLKKTAVPLLYVLSSSNLLVQNDILDHIEVEVQNLDSEYTNNYNISLTLDNGNWEQTGDDSATRIDVKYTDNKLTFKRVRMAELLRQNKERIQKYIVELNATKSSYASVVEVSNKKRRREDEDTTPLDPSKERNAIWADAHREMTISGDRLYVFIRVMAGTLNEDVTAAIHVEDRSLDAAQQEYRKQRSELLRQQRTFSQSVINELLTSVFRSSNFRVDMSQDRKTFENQIVVVNEESIEKVRQLSESTNVQFMSQNVELLRAFEDLKGDLLPLNEFVDKVQQILYTQHLQAQTQLARTQYQRDQNSLEYLSEPRNSFVVRLKNEAFAAIRKAFHEFQNEWRARRIPLSPPMAWELVEGGTEDLTDAFAQYAAYLWSNSRLFSSSTAAFIGVTPAKINLIVLRTALEKLVRRAVSYKNGSK